MEFLLHFLETGISLEQYRAVIDTWGAGRMGKTFDSPATVQLPGSNASGPWKLHALLPSALCPTTFCFCLTALLIIGGVDPNPGTGSHTDDRDTEWITMQEEILAGLCANATILEVRDCLMLNNPHSSNRKHKNELDKWQKQPLSATLDYLGTSGHDQFTKPTCINNLICRTHNQLPDTCNV